MKAKPPKDEPEPVTEFLIARIEQWKASGKNIKDLAKAAHLAKSMPSQIKARTSAATIYSATRLARPFGFKDLPALVNRAYEWWREGGHALPRVSPKDEAVGLARAYGVSAAAIERVLERFSGSDHAHYDALWWLARFHDERSLEREAKERRAAG